MKGIAIALVMGVLLAPLAALAERSDIDEQSIFTNNRMTIVHLVVSGIGPDGSTTKIIEGVGVLVSPNGLILTAGHVVGRDEDWSTPADGQPPAREIEVTMLDPQHGAPQPPIKTKSVQIVPGFDFAVVQIQGENYQIANLASESPAPYSPVMAITWNRNAATPQGKSGKLTTPDNSQGGPYLTAQMAVEDGDSGSPLFDASGRVAGIIVRAQGGQRALALPIRLAMPFLDARGFLTGALSPLPQQPTGCNSVGQTPRPSRDAPSGLNASGWNVFISNAETQSGIMGTMSHRVFYELLAESLSHRPFKNRYDTTINFKECPDRKPTIGDYPKPESERRFHENTLLEIWPEAHFEAERSGHQAEGFVNIVSFPIRSFPVGNEVADDGVFEISYEAKTLVELRTDLTYVEIIDFYMEVSLARVFEQWNNGIIDVERHYCLARRIAEMIEEHLEGPQTQKQRDPDFPRLKEFVGKRIKELLARDGIHDSDLSGLHSANGDTRTGDELCHSR